MNEYVKYMKTYKCKYATIGKINLSNYNKPTYKIRSYSCVLHSDVTVAGKEILLPNKSSYSILVITEKKNRLSIYDIYKTSIGAISNGDIIVRETLLSETTGPLTYKVPAGVSKIEAIVIGAGGTGGHGGNGGSASTVFLVNVFGGGGGAGGNGGMGGKSGEVKSSTIDVVENESITYYIGHDLGPDETTRITKFGNIEAKGGKNGADGTNGSDGFVYNGGRSAGGDYLTEGGTGGHSGYIILSQGGFKGYGKEGGKGGVGGSGGGGGGGGGGGPGDCPVLDIYQNFSLSPISPSAPGGVGGTGGFTNASGDPGGDAPPAPAASVGCGGIGGGGGGGGGGAPIQFLGFVGGKGGNGAPGGKGGSGVILLTYCKSS